jgi:hypothetical protein
MDVDRLPRACYKMLYQADVNGKQNWVTHVKNILFRYGFGFVYISQEVGNIELLIN